MFFNNKNYKVLSFNESSRIFLTSYTKEFSFFKEEKNLEEFATVLKNDKRITEKFKVEEFIFSKNLSISDTLQFSGNETNIYNAVTALEKLNSNVNSLTVLLSDGNQTIGNAYEFINAKQKIYPVVFGDTTKYIDLKISQVNVNKYSYIKNKFPVEVLLNYDGNETVNSKFSILNNGKTVFSKNVQFTPEENSKIITTNLTSAKEGNNYYRAVIQKIAGEKNVKNNSKNFSVEVIDEQTKVLILSTILHPDIGALKKAITGNKQRAVDIFTVDYFKGKLTDYQLIIIYQPNNSFNTIINKIQQENLNYLVITGTNTDWNFINKRQLGFSKKAINQLENYGGNYNASFLTFLQKDIGFNQFSPLQDKFGEVSFTRDHQDLLYQNINGLQTQQPLISFLENDTQKGGVFFGEGIWKWRAASYLSSNSFQEFDQFIGNVVQYLSSNKKRNRLAVNSENLYPANANINIAAFYTDKNYQFDARASLEITITNKQTEKNIRLPLSLINNSYQVAIDNLDSGDYRFKVQVLGQNIFKYGNFKVTDYAIEEQFTHANSNKLEKLAVKTGGKLFYKNEGAVLINTLLADKAYYTTQKPTIKERNLIDWQWVLFLVIALFTAEWFVRKYYGKI